MSRLGQTAIICAALFYASAASAALFSQYTFNDGTATDTLGAWSGTVVDPLAISQKVGGELDLRANNGVTSADADASGAYVDLPNGIVTSALQSGTANAASFEMWVTVETNRFWARLFDFGTSDGGEGVSNSGGGQDYLHMVPLGFSGILGFESHPTPGEGIPPASVLQSANPLGTGSQHHIVVSYDQNNTTAGPGGTATVYLDNAVAVTGPISAGMLPGQLFNENNDWLGRSQYGGDALIDGLYNEFRIYDHALTAAEVATNNADGPVEVSLPTLVVDRETGAVTIENPGDAAQQLTGYTITSAAGGLNASSWDSIAPDTGWTVDTQAATELGESGGTAVDLAAGGSVSIGGAWTQSTFEDLHFSYELTGGTTGLGAVRFVGNGLEPLGRSDLDGDGTVDVDDWVDFLAGNATDLAGLSPVAAYLSGDLNGDGFNNRADFLLFRQDFIADNGAAAFEALAGSVPEPSALALAALLGAIGVVSIRPRARG